MHKALAALPITVLLLTACSGTPKTPTVIDETPLGLRLAAPALSAPDLDARVVHMSDGSAHLSVSNPWQANHRFSHPMLASAWEACRENSPRGHWQLRNAAIHINGETHVEELSADNWQALEAMDVPAEMNYGNARLHATLHFNGDTVAVDGYSSGSVRAGSGRTQLAPLLSARITGISQSPDQTLLDGDIVLTRRLQVEVVNRSNRTWHVNLGQSGGELRGDILSGARGSASPVVYPGKTTNVEIPLLLPVQAEHLIGASRDLDRIELAEMNAYQWQPGNRSMAKRIRSEVLQYDAAAYLVLESPSGQRARGFVDGIVVIDQIDTVGSILCQ